MRLHERTIPVQGLESEIKLAFWKAVEGKDITYVELMQVLNQLQADCLRHMLRHERHPDNPDKRADEG